MSAAEGSGSDEEAGWLTEGAVENREEVTRSREHVSEWGGVASARRAITGYD